LSADLASFVGQQILLDKVVCHRQCFFWADFRYQPTLGRRPTLGREFLVREASKARKKLTESFFAQSQQKNLLRVFF
jgi:hypothetical protein